MGSTALKYAVLRSLQHDVDAHMQFHMHVNCEVINLDSITAQSFKKFWQASDLPLQEKLLHQPDLKDSKRAKQLLEGALKSLMMSFMTYFCLLLPS